MTTRKSNQPNTENKEDNNKITDPSSIQKLIKIRVLTNIVKYLFFDFSAKNRKKFDSVDKIYFSLRDSCNNANRILNLWDDDKLELKEAQCAINSVFYRKIPIEDWNTTEPKISIQKKDMNGFFKGIKEYTKASKAEMEFLGINPSEGEEDYNDFLTKKKQK